MIIRGETIAERYQRLKAEREEKAKAAKAAKAARNRKKNMELIARFRKDPSSVCENNKLLKGYEVR